MIDKVISIALTLKGGRGSGNYGHRGRPGEVGGSGRGTFVGLTSFRKEAGKTVRDVSGDLRQFASSLIRSGVGVVASRMAWGAWANPDTNVTEMEPSWYVRYRGNGEALKYVADTAKKYNQDAAIVWSETNDEDPDAVPRIEWVIPSLSKGNIGALNQMVLEEGLPGWTWDTGKKTLVSAAVSQWGDPQEFLQQAVNVSNRLRKAGYKPKVRYAYVKSSVLTRENDYKF